MIRMSYLGVAVGLLLGVAACSSPGRNFGAAGAGGNANGGGGDAGSAGRSGNGGGNSGGAAAAGGRTDQAGGDAGAGAADMAGAAGSDETAGTAGAAGNGGLVNTAGTAGNGGMGNSAGTAGSGGTVNATGGGGTANAAGTAGVGGSVVTVVAIAQPALVAGKTGVPYAGTITASGGSSYLWSVASGTLPSGLSLQSTSSAAVKIAGTPSEAGQFPITLSVTDGTSRATVDLTLLITHRALFLSDRSATGVNELFLTEVGDTPPPAPTRLSASFPTGGGVSSYAWSPDGSKILYLAAQSAGGAAELWVVSVAAPGTAQRVSTIGMAVSQAVWFGAGNIAAYLTNVGEVRLVDLSGSSPSASKLALSGETSPVTGFLSPSPNGTSLTVSISHPGISTLTYVTWAAAALPTTVILDPGSPTNAPSYSYDGRLGAAASSSGGKFWDLSLAMPSLPSLGNNFSFSWSPNAESLLYARVSQMPEGLLRGTFDSGSLTSTLLVPSSACTGFNVRSWSPDGKHGVFGCGRDVRGISNVATATVGTDVSLLPTGFLANAFTDISTLGWSPDSQWIAWAADRDLNAQYDLFLLRWSAPGTAYKPYTSSAASGVTSAVFAQNSLSVAFVGSVAPQSSGGLYLAKLPASGAPPTASLLSGNAVVQNDIKWLPGSRMIAYRATVSGATQLFVIPVAVDGTAGSVIPISGLSGSGVTSYALSPTN